MSSNGEAPDVFLDVDAIMAVDDRPIEILDVPEWKGKVRLRGLTGAGRDEYEASTVVIRDGRAWPDTENARAKLVARCIVNAEGEPIFTQHDVHRLGQKGAAGLDRVWSACLRLSGLSEEDMKELEGNSGAEPSDGSTSTSPSGSAARSRNSSRASAPAS